ncbi:hypothetical protein MBLNU13_g00860t1 [Cladosporium sp. NU13]
MGNPSAKPPHAKRRRDPDEPRKKKKIRISKRQPQYHSSSEDEGSDNASSANAIPLKPRVAKKKADEETIAPVEKIAEETATKPSATPAKPKSTPAKPILKHTLPIKTKKPAPESDDEDEEEESDDEAHDLATNTALNAAPLQDESDADEDIMDLDEVATGESSMDDDDDEPDLESDTESMTSSNAAAEKKKRNDPNAFATSMSKILDTKLSTSKRADPVLSRSKTAAEANKSLADSKLESKARAQIKTEKRALLEKGRVKDVLGLENENVATGAVMEEEKRLKKTAQRGVVKLFNAVRAAQVKAETAMKAAKEDGVVGLGKREERMNEMSKQGFLDLISSGGKPTAAA